MPWVWLGGVQGAFLAASGGSSAGHRQSSSNSCWASSARHIWNFLHRGSGNTFDSDVQWASTLPPGGGYSVDRIASASAALEDRGCEVPADENAIPTLGEIAIDIAAGTPLLVNIGRRKRRSTLANLKAVGGHWVVIVGVNVATRQVGIFDPATGEVVIIDYDALRCLLYSPVWYYNNTTYVGKPNGPPPPPPSAGAGGSSSSSSSSSTMIGGYNLRKRKLSAR